MPVTLGKHGDYAVRAALDLDSSLAKQAAKGPRDCGIYGHTP